MNVTTDLLHIVEQAHSLVRILEAATRVIADGLHMNGCFVFLLDERGCLVRRAAYRCTSSGRSERADADAQTIATQVTAERRVATARGEATSRLASPMLLRDAMVGALVLESAERRDFSADDVAALATTCAQLVGIIENARIVDALDRGERPAPRAAPPSSSGESEERILRGVGASPGVAIGAAVFGCVPRVARWLRAPTRASPTRSAKRCPTSGPSRPRRRRRSRCRSHGSWAA